MYKKIHTKSLQVTLAQNKSKLQKRTKELMAISLLLLLVIVVLMYIFISKLFTVVFVPIMSYIAWLIYRIYAVWKTDKKIVQKIKEMQFPESQ